MRTLQFYLVLGGLFCGQICSSQTLTENYYSKIVINEGEEYVSAVDSIYIDTLILRDESRLRFLQRSKLIVEKAFIGKNCELTSGGLRGSDGKRTTGGIIKLDGEDGTDGADLMLIIVFYELNSLSINTSGGFGGTGVNGKQGSAGQNGTLGGNDGGTGERGGNGGDGGNGGNLSLHYSCEGFNPVFNGDGPRSIKLIYGGGLSGSGGLGGKGGPGGEPLVYRDYSTNPSGVRVVRGVQGKEGIKGLNGFDGNNGKEGDLILKRIP
jgi:hypothetical protein